MKRLEEIIFALVFVMSIAGAVWAVDAQDVKVEYSADEHMETEQLTMHSRVFRAPGKERKEMMGEMGAPGSITIIRKDKGVVWTLMPQTGMYMEEIMGAGEQGSEDMKITEQSVVGEEVIDGRKTTKSKVIVKDSQGRAFGGFMWVTKEGIMVKMDSILKSKDEKMRMKRELKNLKVEKQDPKLFEIPAGYRNMSSGFGGMTFGSGSSSGKASSSKTGKQTEVKDEETSSDDDEEEDEEETESSSQESGSGKMDKMKMFKKLIR